MLHKTEEGCKDLQIKGGKREPVTGGIRGTTGLDPIVEERIEDIIVGLIVDTETQTVP